MTAATAFAFLAAAAGVAAGGYALLRLVSGGLSRCEKIGWSLGLGVLLAAVVSTLLLGAGVLPGPKKFVAALILLGGASALILRPGRSPAAVPPHVGGSRAARWLAIGTAAAILLFAAEAYRNGTWSTDYLAIWGFKAKTIFETGRIPQRLFDDPAVAFSNPRYPLLVPLALSSFAAAMRGWDEHALALLYPCLQIATVLVVAGFLARRVSAAAGALGGLLVALCAGLYAPVNLGTAEVPMALGFALAATAWLDFRDRAEASSAACLGVVPSATRLFLASLFCAATKSEGSLFILILFLAEALRSVRRRRWPLRESVAMLLPVALHAGTLRLLRGDVPERAVDWSLLFSGNAVELLPRAREVLAHLIRVELVSAAAPIACLAALWIVSERGVSDALTGPLVLQVACYAGACVLSAFDPIWQVESAFGRITLTLFPMVALVVGGRLAPRGERGAGSARATARRLHP